MLRVDVHSSDFVIWRENKLFPGRTWCDLFVIYIQLLNDNIEFLGESCLQRYFSKVFSFVVEHVLLSVNNSLLFDFTALTHRSISKTSLFLDVTARTGIRLWAQPKKRRTKKPQILPKLDTKAPIDSQRLTYKEMRLYWATSQKVATKFWLWWKATQMLLDFAHRFRTRSCVKMSLYVHSNVIRDTDRQP